MSSNKTPIQHTPRITTIAAIAPAFRVDSDEPDDCTATGANVGTRVGARVTIGGGGDVTTAAIDTTDDSTEMFCDLATV